MRPDESPARLGKLTDHGLLEKESFPEVPPRTEYHLTAIGRRLTDIIDQLHDLDRDLAPAAGKQRRPAYFVPAGHP